MGDGKLLSIRRESASPAAHKLDTPSATLTGASKGVFWMGFDRFPPQDNQTSKPARQPWVTPMVIMERADKTDAHIDVAADLFYSPTPNDNIGS